MDDVDPEVLKWMTFDELAQRRRDLIRVYDRTLRSATPDPHEVQRLKRAIYDVRNAQVGRE
ncbi:hypothetical protein [Frigoribacterium endophyticum]|uniref:hypothetical protein n=1 Tax=Frigoribacterium endophyticum TaxID=1522176 RepID=UPI0014242BF8|nr:hypothetical protein [Frigoribacterium endophyticum]NII52125.1 hypothetical protein [Frigoribacterium endophyticum]